MNVTNKSNRRQWLALTGTACVVAAAGIPVSRGEEKEEKEKEVSAVEDLMREHGVLRRALLVYAETSSRLAQGRTDIPLAELGKTAALFRTFGEDYHEHSLEESHVFVPLKRGGGEMASLVQTLTAQHERGRQVTDYISSIAKKGRISPADAAPVAKELAAFVRMYQHHAAIEDTIVFPAWKAAITGKQYDELNDEFEELEHKMFGKDGFEDAVHRIAAIEKAFGLADLAALTPPAPPAVGG